MEDYTTQTTEKNYRIGQTPIDCERVITWTYQQLSPAQRELVNFRPQESLENFYRRD